MVVTNQSPTLSGAAQTTTSDPQMAQNMKRSHFLLDEPTPTKQTHELSNIYHKPNNLPHHHFTSE